VLPFGRGFAQDDGETILAAALRHGLYLRHGCKTGGCGTCKARLLEGDAETPTTTFALSADEQVNGWVLLCSSRATDDCTIDVANMDLAEAEFLGSPPDERRAKGQSKTGYLDIN
jgi:ferredoxin